MIIFAIDDELNALEILCRAIAEAEPEAEIRSFDRTSDLLAAVEAGTVPDVLFADGDMPGTGGVELARRLKRRCPNLNVVFATGYDDYMRDALSLHASGYLKKPILAEDVRNELDNLRHPVACPGQAENLRPRVRFQTFGNFEVYIDGKPVFFEREKTKEFLAYLVDRGTICTNAQVAAALWEQTVTPAYLRKLRKDLFDTFRAAGCDDVLIHEWNRQGIRTELVECDYYDWKRGLPSAINAYRGEYMEQYSWAELTHGTMK
ncbi:MAG: response regulator [Clostridia bacterium]|nr:response regulator [Clostridia bacterium]